MEDMSKEILQWMEKQAKVYKEFAELIERRKKCVIVFTDYNPRS